MKRPRIQVLPESAVVPAPNVVAPAPNQFTHTVTHRQPFTWDDTPTDPPAGHLEPGAEVVLMVHDGGPDCRVIDAQGLYVVTRYAGLARRG